MSHCRVHIAVTCDKITFNKGNPQTYNVWIHSIRATWLSSNQGLALFSTISTISDFVRFLVMERMEVKMFSVGECPLI